MSISTQKHQLPIICSEHNKIYRFQLEFQRAQSEGVQLTQINANKSARSLMYLYSVNGDGCKEITFNHPVFVENSHYGTLKPISHSSKSCGYRSL